MARVSILVPLLQPPEDDALARSLASLRGQTMEDHEVLLLDALPAGDLSGLRPLFADDRRVRLVGPLTGNRPNVLNAGVAAAVGAWLAPLAPGDAFETWRLERLTKVGAARRADVVLDNWIADGAAEPYLPLGPEGPEILDIDFAAYLDPQAGLDGGPHLGALKQLLRREFLVERSIGFDVSLERWHDHYLVADVLGHGGRLVLDDRVGYRAFAPAIEGIGPGDILELRAAERRFLRVHGGALTAKERAAAARRREAVEDAAAMMDMHRAWAGGRIMAAAALAMRRPSLLGLWRWRPEGSR